MRRWLVTGAGGMLGTDLREALGRLGEDVYPAYKSELDISDVSAVRRVFEEARPEIVINCAAYTKVDDAELNESAAMAVNAHAVENLARACRFEDALFVQLSTDFVFDGKATQPYAIDDVPRPISVYGVSKLAGERAAAEAGRHLVVRTSWLFGRNGWNFVEAIKRQLRSGNRELRVVSDQRGRPTWTPHLSEALVTLSTLAAADESVRGIFHYADDPEASWFDFASEIVSVLRESGRLREEVTIHPVSTSEFPRPASRPAYSVLSTERYESVTGRRPLSWKDGLRRYLRVEED